MKRDNSFYKNEIREGFFVSSMVKRSWATQMDILECISAICERHNLRWFADCGTLIGAVRHHGFIPWDDDLDICMLKDEYDCFLEYAEKELPSGFKVLNIYKEKEYSKFLTRIVNHESIDTSEDFLKYNHGFPYVAGVDIFPLHYLYNDEHKEHQRCKKAKAVWNLIEEYGKKENDSIPQLIYDIENTSGHIVRRDLPITNALHIVLDEMFSEATSFEASHVALMPFWIKNGNHKYPVEWFDHTVSFPFEDIKVNVPGVYEKKLKEDYHQWTLPIRGGGFHDYPFYTDQEKLLAKNRGGRVYYKYDIAQCDKDIIHAEESDTIEQKLTIAKKADKLIEKCYMLGDTDSLSNLLEETQNLIMDVGDELEKKYSIDTISKIIGLLEDYCEKVYEISIAEIGVSAHIAECIDCLDSILDDALQIYKRKLRKEDDVWFLVRSAEEWKYMETLYQKEVETCVGSVTLIEVPYYEKDITGIIVTESRVQHVESWPSNIEYTEIDTIDINNVYVSKIYFMDPFDQYNMAESVDPVLYSSNLKRHTKELIYVHPFNLKIPNSDDHIGWQNMRDIVLIPGVINSDIVYVQSKELKMTYERIFKEYTPAYNTKSPRIVCYTSGEAYKKVKAHKKKKLLFYIGISSFFENSDITIDKIRRAMDVFGTNKDKINVVWAVDACLEPILKKDMFYAYKNYMNLVDNFIESGIGEYVYSEDYENRVCEVDAYYGSGGYMMNLALSCNKPVMEWDTNL